MRIMHMHAMTSPHTSLSTVNMIGGGSLEHQSLLPQERPRDRPANVCIFSLFSSFSLGDLSKRGIVQYLIPMVAMAGPPQWPSTRLASSPRRPTLLSLVPRRTPSMACSGGRMLNVMRHFFAFFTIFSCFPHARGMTRGGP